MSPTTVGVARYHFLGTGYYDRCPSCFRVPPLWHRLPQSGHPPLLSLRAPSNSSTGIQLTVNRQEQRYGPKPNAVWGKPGEGGGKWGGYAVLMARRSSSHQFGRRTAVVIQLRVPLDRFRSLRRETLARQPVASVVLPVASPALLVQGRGKGGG
jgi:hypothetical protein